MELLTFTFRDLERPFSMDLLQQPSSSRSVDGIARHTSNNIDQVDALPRTGSRREPGKGPETPEASHNTIFSRFGIHDKTTDPLSPAFDFDRWSSTLVNLRNQIGLPTPARSGFIFTGLTVRGSGVSFGEQHTVWTSISSLFNFHNWFRRKRSDVILHGLDGIVQKGELLLVLGRPGSGCTTFLKAITGEMHGLELESESAIQYRGIPHDVMSRRFKGELVYNQEVDDHFPYLTVAQTLEFAAAMRTPRSRLPGITRSDRVGHVVEVMLAVFGLAHARDTIVGDDYVRGVSGGERKRVSIAETALSEAAISVWDNSTRGLDAESALQFVLRLRTLADLTQSTSAAALYQCSQAIVDRFDKILVLYEGREIFFGRASYASEYFECMGWRRLDRQTTGEFLTMVTNPLRREAKDGYEHIVPRTAEEFELCWRKSSQYAALLADIHLYRENCALEGDHAQREFEQSGKQKKAKWMLSRAPQTVAFPRQIAICATRAFQQLQNDRASLFTNIGGQISIALIVASIFHGTPQTTAAFFSYGSALFFAVLLNVLMAITDIPNIYRGAGVISKQVSFAFYRPSAEAFARILVDIPVKLGLAICFNVVFYFLAGFAMTASQFFTFFLFVFVTTLAMSMIFRTIAAATKTLSQAMAVAGVLILALVIYTGFVLPSPYMHPWFKWMSYINPLFYSFEALLVNQAHGTDYPCQGIIPTYQGLTGDEFICPVPGAVAGQSYVSGDAWFEASYGYSYSHLWRNLGIILGFFIFFLFTYLLATELNNDSSNRPDVPVFMHGCVPNKLANTTSKHKSNADVDVESPPVAKGPTLVVTECDATPIPSSRQSFSWTNACLDIAAHGTTRRLLNNVSGWVEPGTLTALMGVSGAGKTTLLDTLAQRISSGIITGEFRVGGEPIPNSFKRDVAYVQQQDIHLETSTVRETLQFSAILRQPPDIPKGEKLQYAEEIIHLLGMDDFADAVVGEPGEGLNVEQRKRLSIGVELAAKPKLLIFLDEPTSGLDSQSSEAIVLLLRRLATSGLCILCTIHQPSAVLFQQFDRLLLMARGGNVAYFGNIGENSEKVLQYFGDRAPRRCAEGENPAEYLLDIIGNTETETNDWPHLWTESAEAKDVCTRLERMRNLTLSPAGGSEHGLIYHRAKHDDTYRPPFLSQVPCVFRRVFQQYWRSPTYIISKFMLGILGALLIGFSFFQPGLSILGTQNAMFSLIIFCAMFNSLAQQVRLLQRPGSALGNLGRRANRTKLHRSCPFLSFSDGFTKPASVTRTRILGWC
ncbi:ABC-2 type transporter-domain-containing protein [Coniochaeta sp. 2T2.1]|nr:ABC-2 type transporter-domain-containing protein [Coniochaeta sp. 2T2.1]